MYSDTLGKFPLGISEPFKSCIILRTLMLNCLTKYYSDLWKNIYNEDFIKDTWSIVDSRLKSLKNTSKTWNKDNVLRNHFERRQALVEIDVLAAMAIGLNLQDLILIYNIQFPVLQRKEDETFYDAKGDIVFTNSQSLTGVGVDRPVWETIKDLKAGETYEHTIEKSELYKGKKVTYYAPFDKCDRVEDYKTAWVHFEKVFN